MERLFRKNKDGFRLVAGESFFVYDLAKLQTNVNLIRSRFPQVGRIFYSVKANPHPAILAALRDLGVGFDVSSEAELQAVLHQGVEQERITFSGPAKNPETLNMLKTMNLYSVHLDSIEEFVALKESACALSLRVPLEESYSQKVGLRASEIEELLREHPGRFRGLHVYLGRERASEEVCQKYANRINSWIATSQNGFLGRPEVFWGGGLPMPEFLQDNMLPKDISGDLHLEGGRVLSGNCGTYFSQVLAVKRRGAKDIVILAGGLQHLASHFSSPRFNQARLHLEFRNNQGEIISGEIMSGEIISSKKEKPADIFGGLGVWHDVLVRDWVIPDSLSRGDWVGIGSAGAYGLTAGTNQFIGSSLCQEFIYDQGNLMDMSAKKFTSYLQSGLNEDQTAHE